ncbi:hypothetical protein V7G09_04895 [Cutibacterium avidum]|jgi:hypothetical protein|uniref:hypothetical protein n=1 Tax=Cutibacterium avidum TaxID=33010 RepID=UPI002068C351|nr:hypothetical protein [Cutibacterium avidum]MDU5809267.1 hypothetical protein [Finegoldia magna]DAL65425.1 MAG TPA_asm: hypothetical protein [Caudoviricetes sp.]MCO6684765.1 hypothetical protein [Cutibacterium avidum]MDU5841438.1 hypothetical protein [Cutibacterium avidum]MDU7429447.1 hypothetical protein [Cutibacterium avidum]
MDDVTALQRLIANRQRDLNAPSLIAMYRAANLPRGAITYETLRRMATGRQRSIRGDQTYEDLSTILRVSVDDVKSAEAGYTPIGGWERYERLNAEERKAVEGVMDAILAAREAGGSSDDRQSEAQKSPLEASGSEEATLAADNPGTPTDRERMEAEWGDEPA